MEARGKRVRVIKRKRGGVGFALCIGIALLMLILGNATSYAAYVRPNIVGEVEPNNTRETAQTTIQNTETLKEHADDNCSGRNLISGNADSSDDDWYKVDLTPGVQYLTINNLYGDNATYVEMWDANNDLIVPRTYGDGYNVTQFNSNGGTYYIHIVGALETESSYWLLVGAPLIVSEEVNILFDSPNTSGTIKKTFSLVNETILPRDAVVRQIVLRDLDTGFNSARITSSSYSGIVPYFDTKYLDPIGELGVQLKSEWEIIFYPKRTVTYLPRVTYRYCYPVYDDTSYPHNPTIRK